jgi:hypothetical protein
MTVSASDNRADRFGHQTATPKFRVRLDASDRVLVKAGFNYEGTLKQRAWFKGAFHDFRMFGRVAANPID